ncbi:alpha/beta hydrolase [Actinoplanes sp. NPDC051513]|uniref:alpha/beta hydrolase n=1 Tax=Actinoplanes sp. NPDC051513 TaxID=3363908 RepID=UPI003790CA48
MTAAVYARLRVADPGLWRAVAHAWRRWATLAGRLTAQLTADLIRLGGAWSGTAATAAAARLTELRRGLIQFRVLCWQADQAAGEFAAALTRAKRLLAQAISAAHRAGLTIDDEGIIRGGLATPGAGGAATREAGGPATTFWAAHPGTTRAVGHPGATQAAGHPGAAQAAGHPGAAQAAGHPGAAQAAVAEVADDLFAAIAIAAAADEVAAERLERIEAAARQPAVPAGPARPDCTASPAQVRRWWDGLTPAERQWLLATEPAWLAPLDGIPAADRDTANRLLLDDRRAQIERALATAHGSERRRLQDLRHGLDALADRLAEDEGPRAYLLRLDLSEEGRVVVALGDPDRADNVVTHVPGMTAELASFGGELTRAERVAGRAAELSPAASTSAVLWLDYDAPDFVDEAASARRAEAGAPALRRFQEGLRATVDGPPARQTVIGHSYGSLLVGKAAAGSGLPADNVVFVGSPGVGVESVRDLSVPPGRVWSTTSSSDVIQYAAPGPAALARDLAVSRLVPVLGPAIAFGSPERDLWFGHNPSDPAFGARTFASAPGAGHLGYWERGSPSLDTLAAITLGTAR